MEGADRIWGEEVADAGVRCCGGENEDPSRLHVRLCYPRRDQGGWGRFEIGVDTEVLGIGAAEGIRSWEDSSDAGIPDQPPGEIARELALRWRGRKETKSCRAVVA